MSLPPYGETQHCWKKCESQRIGENCEWNDGENKSIGRKNKGHGVKICWGYKDKKAAAKIIDIKIVQHQKGISKDQQEIKSKPKDEVFKYGAVARKAATDKIKYQEEKKSDKYFKHEICDYKCEENADIKKHITSNHSVNKCKVCQKEFTTSVDLVSHVAKGHLEDEEALIVQFISTPTSDKGEKYTSFVFSESMLDEFL